MRLVFYRPIVASIFVIGLSLIPRPASGQTFGYFGSIGPAFWGELDAAWATCGNGDEQSPVDIGPITRVSRRVRQLSVDYGATAGEIFNNGHTIEVEVEGDNRLELDGIVYDLVQFHFHTASEHRVEGRGYDMELHLVHKSAGGVNAVVAVLLERGGSSGALAPIFDELPDDLNVHHELSAPFDPEDFLPADRTHYRYEGSLTTPPCTEGVQWVVLAEPATVSDEHMAQFAERIHFNARMTQRALK